MTTQNWLLTLALTTSAAFAPHALAIGASAGMAGNASAGMAGAAVGGGARAGTAIPVGNLNSNGTPVAPGITGASPATITGASPPTISGSMPTAYGNGGGGGNGASVPTAPNTIPGLTVNGAGVNLNGTSNGVVNPSQPNGINNARPGVPMNNSATESPSSF